MRVDIILGGADQVRATFRAMSDELEKLNKQSMIFGSMSSRVSSAAQSLGAPSVSAPPIAIPPIVRGAGSAARGGSVSGIGIAMQGLSALGIEAAPIAGAIAGITALGAAAMKVAEGIRDYADFAFNARGGAQAAGQLAGVSRAAGVDLGEAGGLASNRAGGAQVLNQQIETLRNIKNDEDAARYAKANGIEGYRSVRNMTDEQYQSAKNAPKLDADDMKLVDQGVTDFNLGIQELTVTIEKYMVPYLRLAGMGIRGFADDLKVILDLGSGDFKAAWDDITGHQKDAAKSQLDAADRMNDAANKIHDTIAGGGSRARSAVSGAGIYYNNRNQMNRQIDQLGSL